MLRFMILEDSVKNSLAESLPLVTNLAARKIPIFTILPKIRELCMLREQVQHRFAL